MRGFKFLILLMSLSSCVGVQPTERINAGNTFLREGRYSEALLAYQLAQVNAPDDAGAYFNAAVTFLESRQWTEAEAAFNQSLRFSDENLLPDIYFGLGEVYFRQAAYVEALEAYRQVLVLRPDDEDARYNYELTLVRFASPTPQQSPTATSTESTESQATPTSFETPTPSPEPDSEPEEESQSPTPSPTEEAEVDDIVLPPMNLDTALQLLNDVQQGQGAILQPRNDDAFGDDMPTERDW